MGLIMADITFFVIHIQANNKGNWNETGDVKVSVLIFIVDKELW